MQKKVINNEELFNLLKLAKKGDCHAKEKIIGKYYGYIIAHTKGVYINSYTFEDLVQSGIESILNSIDVFNLDKPIEGFSSYVFLAIKNNFNYLCRKEIRYNKMSSLNITFEDGLESVDFIPSPENIEAVIVETITAKELLFKCELLDSEELALVHFLYLDLVNDLENETTENAKAINDKCTNTAKKCLSDYAKIMGKDYYYCILLKRRALRKLKQHYKDLI